MSRLLILAGVAAISSISLLTQQLLIVPKTDFGQNLVKIKYSKTSTSPVVRTITAVNQDKVGDENKPKPEEHLRSSDLHSSVSHTLLSDMHYGITSSHRDNTDTHQSWTAWNLRDGRTLGPENHDGKSTTHLDNTDTHKAPSDTHLDKSDTHAFPSTTHAVDSFSHDHNTRVTAPSREHYWDSSFLTPQPKPKPVPQA
jgi:hypothetical protein